MEQKQCTYKFQLKKLTTRTFIEFLKVILAKAKYEYYII